MTNFPYCSKEFSSSRQELLAEIGKKEAQFSYEIRDRKAHFTTTVAAQHRKLVKTIASYVRESKVFNLITAPVIWLVLVPVVLLHAMASVFQWICFPVYGSATFSRTALPHFQQRISGFFRGGAAGV